MKAAAAVTAAAALVATGAALGRSAASDETVGAFRAVGGRLAVRGPVHAVWAGATEESARSVARGWPRSFSIVGTPRCNLRVRADGLHFLIVHGATSVHTVEGQPVVVVAFRGAFSVEPTGPIEVLTTVRRLTSGAGRAAFRLAR